MAESTAPLGGTELTVSKMNGGCVFLFPHGLSSAAVGRDRSCLRPAPDKAKGRTKIALPPSVFQAYSNLCCTTLGVSLLLASPHPPPPPPPTQPPPHTFCCHWLVRGFPALLPSPPLPPTLFFFLCFHKPETNRHKEESPNAPKKNKKKHTNKQTNKEQNEDICLQNPYIHTNKQTNQ